MKRVPVTSSVLAEVRYDSKSRILEVTFHSGNIYEYREVPKQVYRALVAAPSKGRYFGARIRQAGYAFRKTMDRNAI